TRRLSVLPQRRDSVARARTCRFICLLCDICQEECPFSRRRSVPTDEPACQPRAATTAPRLVDMLKMTAEEFREKFKGSPVKRAKWRGLLRNVAAALSSSDDPAAEAVLVEALN